MTDKPQFASGYDPESTRLVRAALLFLATKLGDLLDDLVVVGGLVPTLLIRQAGLSEGAESHVGTMDLDLGLTIALLNDKRYRDLTARLRAAGFAMDTNEQGHQTRQRWRIDEPRTVTVDFLIPPSLPDDRGGSLRDIEKEFAAVIAPGLHLAFEDQEQVELDGRTILDERATRSVWVCGPGAYVVLKALAFRLRGENKDAYDLFYLLKYYGTGVSDVAERLRPLLEDESAREAVEILREDFTLHDSLGPLRVARFLTEGPNDEIQADVVGFVEELLSRIEDAS